MTGAVLFVVAVLFLAVSVERLVEAWWELMDALRGGHRYAIPVRFGHRRR